MQVLSYTPHPLMRNGMCFTAQPDHEKREEGFLAFYLLLMRQHFVSRPSFPCNTPASHIHCCHLTSPPSSSSFQFLFPRSSCDQSCFRTYYLPRPDQTAQVSSERFNFSESRLPKNKCFGTWLLGPQPNVKTSYVKKPQKILYFHFSTDAFILTKFLV